MYSTEYDLLVAEDRFRALRDEMKAIRLAQDVQDETAGRPSLLDRLIALTSRGAHLETSHRNGVAA